MKGLIIGLGVCALCTLPIFAEEITTQNTEDNKATIAIQKQVDNKKQKQGAVRNIACIIIQVNGKVQETKGE